MNSNRISKRKIWTQEKINYPKPANINANVFADCESSYCRLFIVTFLPVLLIAEHLISNSSLFWKVCKAVGFYAFRTLFALASYTFLSGFVSLAVTSCLLLHFLVWLYRSTREWQSPPHRVQQKAVGCWDCCCSSALLHGGSGSWFVCELCRPTLPDDECPSMQLYSWWTISYIINTLSLLFASLPSPIPVSRVSWLRSPVLSLHRAGPACCSPLHHLMLYWW